MPATKVTIVVPCYNETRRLRLAEFEMFLRKRPIRFIFVDDGSRDGTGEMLRSIRGSWNGQVTVISNPQNRGKAESVRRGITCALDFGAAYFGFWDADLATPLDTIPEFVEILDTQPGIDIVFGSRVKLLGRRIERRPLRHYLGRTFATAISSVLGLAVYDTQCGAKLFRAGPNTSPLFAKPFRSRWIFDAEVLARFIERLGSPAAAAVKIYEYPLREWVDIAGTKLKVQDFVIALRDVCGIYWEYRPRIRSRPRLASAGYTRIPNG